MKLTNILRGITYAACIAVAVWFYVESKNALVRLAAVAQPAEAVAKAPAVPAPAPVDPQAQIARQLEQVRRAEANKAQAEQAARLTAALTKVAAETSKPKPEPTPAAYSLVPEGSPELIPLEGWVDQPNKNRPGRVHTNLMVRHVRPSAKPKVASRAPCLKLVSKPAERINRPYGYVDVPARTIPVPCGQ